MCRNNCIRNWVNISLYPFMLLSALAAVAWVVSDGRNFDDGYAYIAASISLGLLVMEMLFPARQKWRMTWRSFLQRDIKFIVIGGILENLVRLSGSWLLIHWSMQSYSGFLYDLNWIAGGVLAILLFDFMQYWLHRWSHQGTTVVNRWLWRLHSIHHLPEQVYLLMHPVHHPITLIFVRGLLLIPIFLLGLSAESMLLFSTMLLLQGQFAHLNIDIRAGWFNHLFVGTELHRYHHSQNIEEGKNYGAVITLWDRLFGTYVYRPGQLPEALGIADAQNYPEDTHLVDILLFPFRKNQLNAVESTTN